jgi:formate hydrogenlyase subunit 6/NADH:ubiquinone oxidoreductase subunit I
MEYVSASEARKFKEVTTDFTEKIRRLGASPVGTTRELVGLSDTDEVNKKQAIHAVLKALAEAVGYQPTNPLIIPPEEIMEGYGFPKRDPDKCIGCYACYNTCPEDVITLEDIENKRVFGTLSHACVVCKKCQEACSQEAIEIIPGFELMAYLTQTPLEDISLELLQCKECQRYYTPVKHVEFVEEKVRRNVLKLHIPEDQHELCSDCRRKYIAQEMQKKWLKQAASFLKRGG